MSREQPKTLAEWRIYFEALDAEELWNQASDANSARFVRTLMEEGYRPAEIEDIFTALAKRFTALGQHPPEEGWYDLAALARGRSE
jgi:hypothetical protein